MTKTVREFNRYSISFKKQVVEELENGSSYSYLQKKYDIRGAETIQRWVRSFGRDHLLNKRVRIETMDEKRRLKELEEENKRLKLALADSIVANKMLETLIDVSNDEYKTDLKKNFGNGLFQKGLKK
ncbi:transposase [Cecembia calidifontis]|uniref:Transposase n=1 Tax=Cecembia calidifontis TaxID=1187080 RepID=A0A4Q7PF09_9BACT|nr:transposase [Cecembia calidifontis]RZS96572.1 transposase [Cecembia calidifontis]RZS97110.1 transposase [Cecembia calidifontis]RZS97779.1 transposase [Cecembia calidifontis]RZS98250.1 transposase [Cecembia calidifontis]RZS98504.1 transposase [Cecembia calidifontis]